MVRVFFILFIVVVVEVCARDIYVKSTYAMFDCNGTIDDPCYFNRVVESALEDGDRLMLLPGYYTADFNCEHFFIKCFVIRSNGISIVGTDREDVVIKDSFLKMKSKQTLTNVTFLSSHFLRFDVGMNREEVFDIEIYDCEFVFIEHPIDYRQPPIELKNAYVSSFIFTNNRILGSFPVTTPIMRLINVNPKNIDSFIWNNVTFETTIFTETGGEIQITDSLDINFDDCTFINTGFILSNSETIHIESSYFNGLGIVLSNTQNSLFFGNNITNIGHVLFNNREDSVSAIIIESTDGRNLSNIEIIQNTFFQFSDNPTTAIRVREMNSQEADISIHRNAFDMNDIHIAITNNNFFTINATRNWFGSATGPSDICNRKGEGLNITHRENTDYTTLPIQYFPWCTDESCTTFSAIAPRCPISEKTIFYIIVFCLGFLSVIILLLICTYLVKSVREANKMDKAMAQLKRNLIHSDLEIIVEDEIAEVISANNINNITYSKIVKGKTIGKGSYGVVYAAKLKDVPKMNFAVKELHPHCIASNRAVNEFLVEIKIMAEIHHENVLELTGISIKPAGEDDYSTIPQICLISPLQRCSLRDVLYGQYHDELTLERKYDLTEGIARGMAYLHKHSFIHRDLKPGNVLIDDNWTAKIADMGVSKSNKNTTKMTLRGTALYLAPEAIMDSKYGKKTDVYAFGITICELFSEAVPFANYRGNVTKIMIKIAVEGIRPILPKHQPIVEFIKACIETDPIDRPSFEEVQIMLSEIRTDIDMELIEF